MRIGVMPRTISGVAVYDSGKLVGVANDERLARQFAASDEMLDCLKELVDILDNSPREIDSFTAQPAANIIAKIESGESKE